MRRALRGLVLAAAALAAAGASVPGAGPQPDKPSGDDRASLVYTVTIDDAIHPISARYLKESIERANHDDAALLILRLDTPGD